MNDGLTVGQNPVDRQLAHGDIVESRKHIKRCDISRLRSWQIERQVVVAGSIVGRRRPGRECRIAFRYRRQTHGRKRDAVHGADIR